MELIQAYQFEAWHLWSMGVVFVAAVVRGYSGFGFSAINIIGQSFFLSPILVIPINFMLEICVSIPMLKKLGKEIQFRRCVYIIAGTIFVLPLGYGVIQWIDPDVTRIVLSTIAIVLSLLLWKGFTLHTEGSWRFFIVVGFVAGIVGGVSSMGGIPIVLSLVALGTAAAVIRSNMIFLLMATDIFALLVVIAYDKLTWLNVLLFLAALPLMLLGNALGSFIFNRLRPTSYRYLCLSLLLLLSITNVLVVILLA